MREITHRIKLYNSRLKVQSQLLASSLIFKLLLAQVILSVTAIGIYAVERFWSGGTTYAFLPFWVLLTEIAFIPGFFQLAIMREYARDRALHPGSPTHSLPIMYERSRQRKLNCLRSVFGGPIYPKSLADDLREKWEWSKTLKSQIRNASGIQVKGFFRLPSSAVLAGYLIGIAGIAVTLVVTLLQREETLASLPESWSIFKTLMFFAFTLGLVPIVAFLILVPAIWNGLIDSGLGIRESLDDDYLSDKSFFLFIGQLAELHETREPRLLLKTSRRVRMLTLLLTSPISDLWKTLREARATEANDESDQRRISDSL